MMIFDKAVRPPKREDADAQGCVLAWDGHGYGWVIRHYLNLESSMRWWTRLPSAPKREEEV